MLREQLRRLAQLSGSFYLRMMIAGVISSIAVGGLRGFFVSLADTSDWVLEYRSWISWGVYLSGIAMWIGIILVTRSKPFYQVGDPHPHHKFLAFVEYDEQGHGVWTSVYGDTEAPYRLRKLNEQRRAVGTRISPHSEDSQSGRPDTSVTQQQSVQGVQPNKNQSG
jgi:hypothetical protein